MSDWRNFNLPGDIVRRRVKIEPDGTQITEARHEAPEMDAIFARNAEENAARTARSSSLWDGNNMVKVGSIPLALIEQWRREGIDIYSGDPAAQAKISSYLNSVEYVKLRTAPGKI